MKNKNGNMKRLFFLFFLFAVVPTSDGLLIINPLNVSHAVSIDEHPIILLSGESVLIEDATMIRSGVVGVEITKKNSLKILFSILIFSFLVFLFLVFLFCVWRKHG